MNTNAKKRKPAVEKTKPTKPKAIKNPQEMLARKRDQRKRRKLKKIKANSERVFQFRSKMLAGDADTRKEVEKVVAKLNAGTTKSKRSRRRLNMYKNILAGKFSLEKKTQPKKTPAKVAAKKPTKK